VNVAAVVDLTRALLPQMLRGGRGALVDIASTSAHQRTRTLLTAADENQILEFSMLVGHYVMAAMMLDVAGCEVEPAFSLDTR